MISVAEKLGVQPYEAADFWHGWRRLKWHRYPKRIKPYVSFAWCRPCLNYSLSVGFGRWLVSVGCQTIGESRVFYGRIFSDPLDAAIVLEDVLDAEVIG